MNAEKSPTEPPTTMSRPFIDMPQRSEASPSITSRPPCPAAPADTEAKPFTCTTPDSMPSASPGPALPRISTLLLVHSRRVIAGMAVHLDLHRRIHAYRDVVRAVRVEHAYLLHAGTQVMVEKAIQLPQRLPGEIEGDGVGRSPRRRRYARHTYTSSGTGSKILAFFTSGSFASDLNSEEIAT